MLDVISPCVTFNDHEGSTKCYKYMKEHEEPLQEVSFVPHFEDITVEYEPGTTTEVTMHDGSKLASAQARRRIRSDRQNRSHSSRSKQSHVKGEVLTGVFYVNTKTPNFYRSAEHDRPAAGHAAGIGNPAGQGSAESGDGRITVTITKET